MTATDLAAVIVAVICLAVVVVLVVAVQSLVRTLRELRATVDDLRGATLPMVHDLRSTVLKAGDELERVENVLDRAERISATADVASRLAYKAVAPPLIKTASLVAGAGKATWKMRGGKSRRRAINVGSRVK
ncbi:MAG: hypothetical protein ACI9C1_004061 [Candidatus Aldehydirespiratoraceae bacterium]|jgi:hypothetical protein